MNNKQLGIAWVTGVLLSSIIIFGLINGAGGTEFLVTIFIISLPILIIGGLLIYTLRDKKK